ncbi:hypothetical protein AURDEDRAFT_185695 [Auricularia subglabra TFB-10046 SS5]|nr:hypothetical protein AURDEDRAFT_185695 [Auricularia subglabra TFB-10046 SS5]
MSDDGGPSRRPYVPRGFDLWPDELLLRVLDELDDPAAILVNVSPVSRRFRRIATDDGLWVRVCARILTRFATPGSATVVFKREAWLRANASDPASQVSESMVSFWTRFLRIWGLRLGWWADMDGSHGALFRISANLDSGVIQCDQLLLANEMESVFPSDKVKPGSIPPGVVLERGVLSILTDHAARSYLDIHLLQPRIVPREVFQAQYDSLQGCSLLAERRSVDPFVVFGELHWPFAVGTHGRPPFPTPALIPAIRCPPPTQLDESWCLLTLTSLYGRHLAPLRPPSDLDDDGPVQAGWYSGTYGAHGCELIYVHTVDASRPPERAAAFSWDKLPASAPTGGRRLEGVKLTGDPNVPKGQRSFVGFLSSTTARTRPVPLRSERDTYAPWPLDARGAGVARDFYAGSVGVTAPGVGRIAARWFREPRWTECIVHVASRVEIQLLWLEMGIVTTFRRLDL